jgi:3-oxoacyl-[acyl-carrier protein] reductase
MMGDFDGRSILVTGGGSGIGAGTARYLVERGARVTVCGRRAEKLAAIGEALGPACLPIQGDVTRREDRERIVAAAVLHGGGLSGLVSNAGNMYRGPLAELDEQRLLDIFHTNVVAGMLLSALCLPHLESSRGAIVFLGSIHNRRAFPGAAPYAATKGAIEALTRSLAAELGPRGIRVNCVAPGAVFTEINQRAGLFTDEQALDRLQGMARLHALGRIGTVEEVAQAIAYFILAPWTTGTVLEVDGGLALGITPEPDEWAKGERK